MFCGVHIGEAHLTQHLWGLGGVKLSVLLLCANMLVLSTEGINRSQFISFLLAPQHNYSFIEFTSSPSVVQCFQLCEDISNRTSPASLHVHVSI